MNKHLSYMVFLLFSMTATGFASQLLYFPQAADGQGLRMIIAVSNTSCEHVTGSLSFYDSVGNPLGLPVSGEDRNSVPLDLPVNSSEIIRTDGTCNPARVGFATLEAETGEVTGVVVFKYASGMEASVLPVPSSYSFSVFVERNSSLDTGIAITRSSLSPVTLDLYATTGALVQSKPLTALAGANLHLAQFTNELFTDLPDEIQGTLIVSSDSPIAVTGLRNGAGVLSTVPVKQYMNDARYFSRKFAEPSGMWTMSYTLGIDWNDDVAMWQEADIAGAEGVSHYMFGWNEFADTVGATYSSELGQIVLVDPGNTSDSVYSFTFASPNEVSGCYRLHYHDDGHFSRCYEMTGVRYDASATNDVTSVAANIDPLARLEDRIMIEGMKLTEALAAGPTVPNRQLLAEVNRIKDAINSRPAHTSRADSGNAH